MLRTIAGRRVLVDGRWLDDAEVQVDEHGTIVGVGPATEPVPDVVLAPGLVDLQVNGIDDVDCTTADGADWERPDGLPLAQGVTAWSPTLITMRLGRFTAPLERIATAMHRDPAGRPHIVGAHLEGPFLGEAPGAHRRELIVPIDLAWLRDLPSHVAMVTLGAEQPDAGVAIRLLRERGVLVSVGHSTAAHDAVEAAFDAGASFHAAVEAEKESIIFYNGIKEYFEDKTEIQKIIQEEQKHLLDLLSLPDARK